MRLARLASLVSFALLLAFSLTGCNTASGPQAGGPPQFQLPPGWTEADMQACMVAGTPGKQHAEMLKEVGTWKGTNTMWMYPGADPVVTEASSKVTSFMDGRYLKIEWTGEMPGMGPYHGLGIQGYDNVSNQYVNLWLDNHSTGLMTGTGKLSDDGKTMTWSFPYICPVSKKPAVFRQVETTVGDKKTLDMFGIEPKSGVEYRMMRIEITKR